MRSSSVATAAAFALVLRREHRPRVDVEAIGEDELEQQQRADVAHVVDRLRQPAISAARPDGVGAEDRAVRAADARLVAGGFDQLPRLEDLERAVDERPPHRPHAAELAVGRQLRRDRPAVSRPFAQQGQHRPLPRSEDPVGRH